MVEGHYGVAETDEAVGMLEHLLLFGVVLELYEDVVAHGTDLSVDGADGLGDEYLLEGLIVLDLRGILLDGARLEHIIRPQKVILPIPTHLLHRIPPNPTPTHTLLLLLHSLQHRRERIHHIRATQTKRLIHLPKKRLEANLQHPPRLRLIEYLLLKPRLTLPRHILKELFGFVEAHTNIGEEDVEGFLAGLAPEVHLHDHVRGVHYAVVEGPVAQQGEAVVGLGGD